MASLMGLRAQQDAQYTQYVYNTISVNPAYAGSRGVLSLAALYRSQWVGVEGAPNSQTINLHTPLSERVGIGFNIVNDEIGNRTNQNTYFDAAFSYTISTSREGKLAFGVKASGHLLNIDFSQLQNFDNSTTQTNIDKRFSPNFGAGLYYYRDDFYAGLSVPNFLKTEHFDNSGNSSSSIAQQQMNWYLMTGYIFELNPEFKLKPAALVRAVQGAPLQVDLSATALFNDKFSFGAAYRWSAALSALVGYQYNDKLLFGLAYDREISELGNSTFNDGSFEFFLRYEFKTRYRNVTTPRFF